MVVCRSWVSPYSDDARRPEVIEMLVADLII
jgi:hypothetical protein